MVLLAAALGAAYFYIWPNLSGNWVKHMDKAHPEVAFSSIKLDDSVLKLPKPLIALEGSPKFPTKSACQFYFDQDDGLGRNCKYKAADGLTYETDGVSVLDISLELESHKFYMPLPFGVMPSENPEQLISRLKKLGFKIDDIYNYSATRPRFVGWPINENPIDSSYTKYIWFKFDDNNRISSIGVGYIDFD